MKLSMLMACALMVLVSCENMGIKEYGKEKTPEENKALKNGKKNEASERGDE